MAASSKAAVEEVVKQGTWEPRHEWESRVMFIEDNVDRYGLEKATTLSMVWANMHFLGCSYPPRTEALVAHYPLPDMDTLRARRKERKRKTAPETQLHGKDKKGLPRPKKIRPNPEPSTTKASETRSSDGEDTPDFDTVSSQLGALIAAVRKQQETENIFKEEEEPSRSGKQFTGSFFQPAIKKAFRK